VYSTAAKKNASVDIVKIVSNMVFLSSFECFPFIQCIPPQRSWSLVLFTPIHESPCGKPLHADDLRRIHGSRILPFAAHTALLNGQRDYGPGILSALRIGMSHDEYHWIISSQIVHPVFLAIPLHLSFFAPEMNQYVHKERNAHAV
jgi:hypothetical protein